MRPYIKQINVNLDRDIEAGLTIRMISTHNMVYNIVNIVTWWQELMEK